MSAWLSTLVIIILPSQAGSGILPDEDLDTAQCSELPELANYHYTPCPVIVSLSAPAAVIKAAT